MIDVQVPHSWQLEAEPVRALAFAVHSNPFAALGPQGNANGRVVHIDGLWVDAVASSMSDRHIVITTVFIAGFMLGAYTVQLKDQISLQLGTLGLNAIMRCSATGP